MIDAWAVPGQKLVNIFSGMCNYPCYLPVTYLDLAYLYNIVVKNLFGEGQNTLLFLEIGNMYGARYEKTIFF